VVIRFIRNVRLYPSFLSGSEKVSSYRISAMLKEHRCVVAGWRWSIGAEMATISNIAAHMYWVKRNVNPDFAVHLRLTVMY